MKKENLSASMPSLIMSVVLIVGIGAVLGVTGYLAKNKPKTILTVTPSSQEKVAITTDKIEYEQGETVNITVKNGLDKSIWYIKVTCPPSCCSLYRWENNEWKNLGNPMSCIYVSLPSQGRPPSIETDELKIGESTWKQWNMMIKEGLAESGKYRFSFYYGLSKESYTEKTIYSNEFTIKGKSAKEKIDSLIIGKLNSEEKINIIIYSYDTPNQDMVQILQNEGAENVKLIESEPIKKEGIETMTKDAEPLFITATIKAKNSTNIAELSWIRKIILNIEMISQ